MSDRDNQRQWELQQEFNRQKDAHDQQSYEQQLLDRIEELEAKSDPVPTICDLHDQIESLKAENTRLQKEFDSLLTRDTGNLKKLIAANAEVTRLRKQSVRIYNSGYMSGHHDTVESCFVNIYLVNMDTYQDDVVSELLVELEECEG